MLSYPSPMCRMLLLLLHFNVEGCTCDMALLLHAAHLADDRAHVSPVSRTKLDAGGEKWLTNTKFNFQNKHKIVFPTAPASR